MKGSLTNAAARYRPQDKCAAIPGIDGTRLPLAPSQILLIKR